MKGVMMLVNYFPPLPSGGAERQAERLAGYLAAQGVRVGVLTRRVGELSKQEERNGFFIFRLPAAGPGKVRTFVFTMALIFTLLRLRHEYDILHAHLAFSPAFAAAIAGYLLGKRVIVKFGNSNAFGDVQRSERTLRGRLRMAILRRWADVIITLDTQMEMETISAGFDPDRVLRMDNGINSQDFLPCNDKPVARQALSLDGKIIALYTGRLTSQKALPVLFRAMQHAIGNCPDLYLILVGSGEEKTTLLELAKNLNIDGHISFVESVNDVRPYLNAADIFVLPSLAEGISNSLLEAMSCELACITTAVGGSLDVLANGEYGLLIPPNDVDALAAALVFLGNDPEERVRLGTKARQHILNRYDFQIVGSQYFALYQQLIEDL